MPKEKQFPVSLEGIASGGICMRNQISETERLERFNAKALDDIAIEEQNINPHQCDHAPNYLIPIDIEFDPVSGKQIIRQKCMCCNKEIIDEVEHYKQQKNNIYQFMEESYMN